MTPRHDNAICPLSPILYQFWYFFVIRHVHGHLSNIITLKQDIVKRLDMTLSDIL